MTQAGDRLLCCGLVGDMAHVAWPLEEVAAQGDQFLLLPRTDPGTTFQFVALQSWADFKIEPTEVVSPARVCLTEFSYSPYLG